MWSLERETLGQRWPLRWTGCTKSPCLGVEQINTTISQLVIPALAAELEEIVILHEESYQMAPTPLKRSLPPDQSSHKRSLLTDPSMPVSTGSSQDTLTISFLHRNHVYNLRASRSHDLPRVPLPRGQPVHVWVSWSVCGKSDRWKEFIHDQSCFWKCGQVSILKQIIVSYLSLN